MEGQLNNNQDLIHPPPLCQVTCDNVTVKREEQTLRTSKMSYLSDTNSVEHLYKRVNEVTTMRVQGIPVNQVTKCHIPNVNIDTKQPDGSTDMNLGTNQTDMSPDLNIKREPFDYDERHGIKSSRFKTENILHDSNKNVHKDCQLEISRVYTMDNAEDEPSLSSQTRAGFDGDSLHGAIKDHLSSSRDNQIDSKNATKPLLTTVEEDVFVQSGFGLIPVSVVTLRKQDHGKATPVSQVHPAERHPKTPSWKATSSCERNNNETPIGVAQTLESEYSPYFSQVVKSKSQFSKQKSLVHNGSTAVLSYQQKRLSCVSHTKTEQDLCPRYIIPTLIREQDLRRRSCCKDVRIILHRINYPVKSETQKANSNISKHKVADKTVSGKSKPRKKNVRSRNFDRNAKPGSKDVRSYKLETNTQLTNKTKPGRLNQPMKIREINSEDVLTSVSPGPPDGDMIKHESEGTNRENFYKMQNCYRRQRKSYPGTDGKDGVGSRGNMDSLFSEKAKKIHEVEAKEVKKEPSNKTDRRYQCNICHKEFKQSGHMRRHLFSHDENKPFECKICNAGFKRRDTLNVHMRAHTGDARYACQDCGKKFMTSDRLLRHTRIHTGEKLYACKMCSKRFTQNGDLVKHMATHSKVKKFPCSICSRSYSQHFVLKRHMLESHSEKKYQCYTCLKKFTRLTTLRDHMKLHEVKRKKPGVNQMVIKEENIGSREVIVKRESK